METTPIEAPKPIATFQPLIDKVAVPIFWFGIGYLAATLLQRPRRQPVGF